MAGAVVKIMAEHVGIMAQQPGPVWVNQDENSESWGLWQTIYNQQWLVRGTTHQLPVLTLVKLFTVVTLTFQHEKKKYMYEFKFKQLIYCPTHAEQKGLLEWTHSFCAHYEMYPGCCQTGCVLVVREWEGEWNGWHKFVNVPEWDRTSAHYFSECIRRLYRFQTEKMTRDDCASSGTVLLG